MNAMREHLIEWANTNGLTLSRTNPPPGHMSNKFGVGFFPPPAAFSPEECADWVTKHTARLIAAIEFSARQANAPLTNLHGFLVEEDTAQGEKIGLLTFHLHSTNPTVAPPVLNGGE